MRPGDQLGGFVLRELLGTGGIGEVWRADAAEMTGRSVAVKVGLCAKARDVLRTEARLQQLLLDPNVLPIFAINPGVDPPYLVMEYAEGGSLRARLIRTGPLSPECAVAILRQVLSGLSAAHDADLVHGDIKPQNVLLTSDGVAKLADFGMELPAGPGGATAPSAAVPRDGPRGEPQLLAGIDYMAPEQRQGERADVRTDIYRSGLLLYEMLVGDVQPVRLSIPGPPDALSKVVERMIEAVPGRRFQAVDEVDAALEVVLASPWRQKLAACPFDSAGVTLGMLANGWLALWLQAAHDASAHRFLGGLWEAMAAFLGAFLLAAVGAIASLLAIGYGRPSRRWMSVAGLLLNWPVFAGIFLFFINLVQH